MNEKYLNAKVRCVDVRNDKCFVVGTIYDVVDGIIIAELDIKVFRDYPVSSIDEINSRLLSRFELVSDASTDDDNPNYWQNITEINQEWVNDKDIVKWKPSIHIPKEATRIFLRVTDVRVEKVHDITREQAIKEGFNSENEFMREFFKTYPKHHLDWLFNDEDLWVWVYEFERIEI